MKGIIYTVTCIALIFCFSCNKPIPVYNAGPFDYKLTTYFPKHVATNGSDVLGVSLKLISGYPENEEIHVVISGAPLTVTLVQTNYSFKLHNGIQDSFHVHNAARGDYPIQIEVSSPSTGIRYFTDTLHIDSTINRVAALVGNYNASDYCGYETLRKCTLASINDTSLRFMIINHRDSITNDTTYALADNFSSAFTIPQQNVAGVLVSGSGYPAYYGLKMTKSYTTGSSSLSCHFDLFKLP